MSSGVYKRCGCRDRATGRKLGARCPRLRQRGHGSWSFCLDLPRGSGKKRRQIRRGGFATQQAAWEAREFLRNPDDIDQAAEIVTVGEWLRWWVDHLEDLRVSTVRGYRSHVRLYLIPKLGERRLLDLTSVQVQAAFTSIARCRAAAGHPLARGTLKRIHATLRAALNYAVSLGVIEDNPARMVRLPPGGRPHAVVWTAPRLAWWHRTGTRPAVAVWTVGQTAQFLSWLRESGEPLYPLFHVAAMLGLRRGELAGLQWGDVDFAARVLVVSRQVRREPGGCLAVVRPKSEASNRVVALDQVSLAVLRRLREQRIAAGNGVEPATFLFPGYGDRPVDPDRLTKLFRRLNTASGLPPVRLHDLRHGAASLALAAGNDLKFVQALLGHASIVLTADTYASVLDEHAHRGARATAELILVTEKRLARRLRKPARRQSTGTSRARRTRQIKARACRREAAGHRAVSASATR